MKVKLKAFEFDQFLPDFRLTKPEEMHANPNHDRPDPASLVVHVLDRLPFQRPMPAYHPRIEKGILLERLRKPIGEMLQTDRLFHLLSRERAVERNEHDRIASRKLEERIQFELHGERWVSAELLRRVIFYKKVQDIILSRKTRHEKARLLQVAAFEFLRERGKVRATNEDDRIRYLIHRAAENARAWSEYRTDELYVQTDNHTYRRLKVHGKPREAVVDQLHWEWARLMTEMNDKWRLENLRVTLPNGGIGHTKIGGGKPFEEVSAKQHLPVIRERSEKHEFWHDTNFQIETPNHSLMHAKQQGAKPEAATAALILPVKYEKTKAFAAWHDGNFLIETPNHSLQPATKQGGKPERATAELAQPIKDEKTEKFRRWHDRSYLVETPNGSLQPATKQGDQPEAAHANLAQPIREEKTAAFELWHESHKYKRTPNGGYAPLLHVGKSIEFVQGEYTQEVKEGVTRHHLERRLANLYAPTENGTWRRLARTGKSVEHVSADVVEQHARDLATKDERATHARIQKARKSLKEIHRNLAAHETQRSLLQEHAVTQPTTMPERLPEARRIEPVPEALAISKTPDKKAG